MLSLIIPTYQERDNLAPLFARLRPVLASMEPGAELLVVDGASPDGTAQVARRLLSDLPSARVVELPRGCDLAQAVREGIRLAAGDAIGVMDADLSHPPEVLPQLVAAVRAGSDVAVASRYVSGGKAENWPWHRRAISRAANALARPLVRVADATSGYFVCRASLVKSLPLGTRGFKVLLDILATAPIGTVHEIPYTFTDRRYGMSKLGVSALGRYLTQLARLYVRRRSHEPVV